MRTKHLCFIACLLICTQAFAQVTIERQAIAGGGGDDRTIALCVTADRQGLLTAGISNSDSGRYKRQNSRGGYDFYVIKSPIARHGWKLPEWSKTIGGSSDDKMVAAVATQDGGFLLAGNSNSNISGEKSENNLGQGDYWLVKLNSKGTILWDKTIGDGNENILMGMDETTDGGFILAGTDRVNASSYVRKITKTDKDGNIRWQQTTAPTGYVRSIQQTDDNGFVMALDSSSDYFVIKADSLGNRQWSKKLTTGRYIAWYAVKQTSDGGYVFYGTNADEKCESCGEYGYYYGYEASVEKLDSNGNHLWKWFDYGGEDFLDRSTVALEETYDHHFIFGTTSTSKKSYYLEKIDNTGKILWEYRVGNYRNQYLNIFSDIKEIRPNRYVVGGYTMEGINDIKTLPNLGEYDYWIIEMADTATDAGDRKKPATASLQTTGKDKALFFYPNPARDIIQVRVAGKATLLVFDVNGKVMRTINMTDNAQINVSSLPNGTYFIKNQQTGEVATLEIVH